jgi:hypothetical protein
MTFQTPDRFRYRETEYSIDEFGVPLASLFDFSGFRSDWRSFNTACNRGYVATYSILDSRLVMADLWIYHFGPKAPIINGVTPFEEFGRSCFQYNNMNYQLPYTGRLRLVGSAAELVFERGVFVNEGNIDWTKMWAPSQILEPDAHVSAWKFPLYIVASEFRPNPAGWPDSYDDTYYASRDVGGESYLATFTDADLAQTYIEQSNLGFELTALYCTPCDILRLANLASKYRGWAGLVIDPKQGTDVSRVVPFSTLIDTIEQDFGIRVSNYIR